VDPLAEHPNQIDKSPYSAFWNNPIRYNDPDGRCPSCDDDMSNVLATEILNVKHSLYNLIARPFGYEATFVKNERGNYETGFAETSDGFGTGALKYGLDALNIVTFGRGGGATGGLLTKTTGKVALTNQAKNSVSKYDVGTVDDLLKRSNVGDNLDIHHVVQKKPGGQVIEGYNPKTAPGIALPSREHKAIPTLKGDYSGNARSQLANDIFNLRKHTNAPNSNLQQLIQLNKETYPIPFIKKP
jgi:hypothetical protein